MGARVVFDTNVLISALGWNAKPENCLKLVIHGRVNGYISPAILDELTRVMDYPRLELTEDEKQSFLEVVLGRFHVVEPAVNLELVSDDPDDDMILECAVAADADYVVSGDSHLLELESDQGVEIVRPAKFLSLTHE